MSKQLDASQTIERFGVSRTAWRVGVICFFALFALLGAVLSLVNGSTDIPFSQIMEILAAPGTDPHSMIIWNIRLPRTIVCGQVRRVEGFEAGRLIPAQLGTRCRGYLRIVAYPYEGVPR